MTSPCCACSKAVELVLLPLLITRPVTPVLSRITRPVPVCVIVPRLVKVALLPEIATALVLPLTDKVAPADTDPACPAALPSVLAAVSVPLVTLKLAAEADCAHSVKLPVNSNAVTQARTDKRPLTVTE